MFQSTSISIFPINTVVLIILLAVVLAVLTWFVLASRFSITNLSRARQRNVLAVAGAILAIWLVVRLGLAIYPINDSVLSTPAVVGLTIIGLSIGLLPLLWAPFREVISAIPITWLIAIHIVRFAGGSDFITLLDAKLLPANFALPAGYGEIFVALLSLVVIYLIVTKRPNARIWVMVWLVFGFVDFISAFVTGGAYIGTFAAQLTASGKPTSVINYVLLIPTYIVPILASIQFYIIYQLLSTSERSSSAKKPFRSGPLQDVIHDRKGSNYDE